MQIVFVNVSFSFRFNAWIIHDVIYTYVDFRWRIKNVWTKWSSVCLYFEFPWKKKKDYSHTKYQNYLINSYPVAVIIFLNNLLIRVIKQVVCYTYMVVRRYEIPKLWQILYHFIKQKSSISDEFIIIDENQNPFFEVSNQLAFYF